MVSPELRVHFRQRLGPSQVVLDRFLLLQVAVPRSRVPLRVQSLRVNNVEIPNSKRVEISLQYIYGIGSTTAKAILVNTVSAVRAGATPQ